MNPLIIANTQIRCDPSGRYCLNDLHQASGAEKRHQPNSWMVLAKTRELVEEIEQEAVTVPGIPGTVTAVVTVQGGAVQGTYAVKELVYAYAMWISAKFHLHVIRAYDAMVTAQAATAPSLTGPQQKADQMVGGGRVFNVAFRTARMMGLPRSRAVSAANAVALRHTDVNWLQELDAGDVLHERLESIPGVGDWPDASRVVTWLQDRTEASLQDIIDGVFDGLGHEDRVLWRRLGHLMASLGWTKYRPRSRGGRFVYRRPGTY